MFIMQCDISYILNHTTCSVGQTEAALRSELEELRNKESVMLFMREKERKVSNRINVPFHLFTDDACRLFFCRHLKLLLAN